jgi:hypothetical protein
VPIGWGVGSASLIRRLHCCEAASPQKITVHWDEICSVAKKKTKERKKKEKKDEICSLVLTPKKHINYSSLYIFVVLHCQ